MTRYFLWMLASASLGLSKALLLAKLLPPGAFGEYSVAMGGIMLGMIVLSFGVIEGTIKAFPRLWASGDVSEVASQFRSLSRLVVLRSSIVGLVVIGVCWLVLPVEMTVVVMLAGVVVGANTAGRLVTAVVLASGEVPPLLNVTVFRSAVTCACAVLAAWNWGVVGALLGEVVGAVASLVYGWRIVRRVAGQPADSHVAGVALVPDRELYSATVLTSVTLMSDRALVAAAASSVVAGSFAFAMILAQIGQLFMNILAQRVGPEIIRITSGAVLPSGARRVLVGNALGLMAGTAGIAVVLLLAGAVDPIAALYAKYQVSATTLVLASLVCICMFYSVLEYALIAVDRERTVLVASTASAVTFVASFAVTWLAEGGVDGYLAAVLATRGVHVAWLATAIMAVRRGNLVHDHA